MADNLTADGVLLSGEGQGHECRGADLSFGGGRDVNVLSVAGQADVLKPEWGRFGCRGGIFARAEEEEEGEHDHIGDGCAADAGGGKGCV